MTEEFFLKAVGMFLIAMVRFTGFFVNVPAFGEGVLPMRVKAGLSALCALIVLPHLLQTQTLPEIGGPAYGLMIFREMIIGVTLGYVVMIAVDSLKFAGEIMGMQIGFSFVQVVDPESSRGQGLVAEFFQVLGVLLFLILGGHIILLQTLAKSFDIVPLSGAIIQNGLVSEIAKLTASIFSLGLQIAMPIIAIILIGDVALGIIAKTVPRMNIFQVGFSVKILLGLWTVLTLLPFVADIIKTLYLQTSGNFYTILNLMHR